MLSAQERIQVAQVWDLIAGHEASFGAELLLRWVEAGFPGSQGGGHRGLGPESEERPRREISGCLGSAGAGRTPGGRPPHSPTCSVRLFTVYPSTKSYFKHLGFCPDETQLLTHGQRMLEAVGVAVQHMDNLRAALSPLADLHAQVLRVDPSNFPLLIQCFQVVLASHLQGEFTVEMQAAWDKFLTGVAVVLTEKYR
ncbi:hemoglobin subunit mu isoform X1 [Mirounga angustirostris]|uniref:hemoglobin subunit mu isoform X1 n=1 Tax=Mirounga angustirostris TaxID=9716 RepID=UPI00313DBC49